MASLFDRFSNRAATMNFKADPTKNEITSFAIDVTSKIDTKLSASVTNFPVEGRGNITDHIQPAPLTLTLSCMISESPSQALITLASSIAGAGVRNLSSNKITQEFSGAIAAAGTAAVASQIGKKAPAFTGKAYNKVDFAPLLTNRKAYDPNFPKRAMVGLTKMFQQGTIFDLHTFFTSDIYSDMVMTSLTFSQTPKEGESLFFTMTCKQVDVTESVSVLQGKETTAANPAGGSASQNVDKGTSTKGEGDSGSKSFLKKIGDSVTPVVKGYYNAIFG